MKMKETLVGDSWAARARYLELSELINRLETAEDSKKLDIWRQIFECLGEQFASEVLDAELKETFIEQLNQLDEQLLPAHYQKTKDAIAFDLRSAAAARRDAMNSLRAVLAIVAVLAVILGIPAALLFYTCLIAKAVSLAQSIASLTSSLYGSVNVFFLPPTFPMC